MTRLVHLASVGLLALLAVGCGPTQADIEKSVKDEMKTQLSVNISTVALTKQGDGSYVGTATTDGGDVYDVTTQAPKGNKIEWKAVQGQAMIEKVVRDGIKQKVGADVKDLQLTKSSPGHYTGTAELTTGEKRAITIRMEGTQLMWEAKPLAGT